MNTPLRTCNAIRYCNPNLFLPFLFLVTFLSSSLNLNAQAPGCPNVDAGPDVTVSCDTNGCADLSASFLETGETTSYEVSAITYDPPFPFTGLANPVSVGEDDVFSEIIDLPFDFCYFGDTYNQVIIGSNGVISFDLTNAGDFCDFSLGDGETIPTTVYHPNAIMLYHDIDPRFGNAEIGFEVLGEAPCRTLVVSFANVPYYFQGTDSGVISTFQMDLYETTNAIEFYVETKPDPNPILNTPINGGRAVLGIQNSDGSQGFTPPDRNTSVWEATEEAWRFTPNGTSNITFSWLDSNGNVISDNPDTTLCPLQTETYTAEAVYTNCNGDTVTVTDEVEVTVDGLTFTVDLGDDQYFCDTSSYEIVPELDGSTTGATYLWSTGETTPTIVVSTTDTYSVEVTVAGCTLMDVVMVTFFTSPDCTIPTDCSSIDFEENFGTGTGRVCDLGNATTTYVCNDATQVNDGEYSITNTSNGLNTGWHPDMEDHTEGDVDGRALYVNADFAIGEFYRRTITLTPNTDFSFRAWITTVYDIDTGICGGTGIPSNVIFRIEDPSGNLIEETNTGDIQNESEPNWQEFFINFNTGVNTDIQLVLINNAPGGCGNDLAIDDITLTLENTPPVIVAPDDMSACEEDAGSATFDLTSVIDTVLDGQDPSQFNVTFHTDQLQAELGVNAISSPDSYVNVENPETIFVRVETGNLSTCFSVVDFDLIVDLVLDFQIDLQSAFDLCSTDGLPTLDATPQNPDVDLSIVTYEWTNASGTVVSTDAIFTPTTAGSYTVVVTSLPCSIETLSTSIIVTEIPTLDLGADEVLCDGGIFDIVPTITGDTNGISYLWSTGETTSSITVDATGTYSLEITVGPCTVSDSIDIVISDPITVEVTPGFKTCPEEPETISATASDPDAVYQWFLNGDILTGETNSTLEFTIPAGTVGTQIYSVVATQGECTGENEVAVTLYDVGNCVISQGISPNGSPGFNDELDLEFLSDRTGGITNLQIFNRLGALVFERSNYIKEWVGQDKNGNELPTGTYFYVIDFLNEDPVYGPQATGWIYLNKER